MSILRVSVLLGEQGSGEQGSLGKPGIQCVFDSSYA